MRERRARPIRLALPVLLCVGALVAAWLWIRTPTPGGSSGSRLTSMAPRGVAAGYNVLLLTIDTLRADHLGCYGHGQSTTPVLDGLARKGVRFRHASSSAPVTLPSHATILTGLQPPSHGVHNNGTFRLDQRHTTLGEVLRDAGYRTAAFVGTFVLDARFGLDQGFDHYDDDVNPTGIRARPEGHDERPAALVTDAALTWFRANPGPDSPFFAWVHYYDPHAPYSPPPEYRRRFPDSPYDGEIAYVDASIERILTLLSEQGRLEKTLIVVTSDHGEGLGEHQESTHTLLIYESTMAVPLIFSSAGLFPRGEVFADGVVSIADVFPTVLGLLGTPVYHALDGIDVFADPPGRDRAVYAETLVPLYQHGWSSLYAMRRRDDKFILAPEPEYYRLSEDPGELHNLHATSPPGAAELARLLEQRRRDWGTLDTPTEPVIDQETLDRLASLGYTRSRGRSARPSLKDPKKMISVWQETMKAARLSLTGQHQQALSIIEPVLADQPQDAHAWYHASRIYRRLGDWDRAESALKRGVELNPLSGGYVDLAQYVLHRQGRREELEAVLRRAEQLDPRHGGIYMARASYLAWQKDYEQALEQCEKAREVDPYRWGVRASEKIEKLRRLRDRP